MSEKKNIKDLFPFKYKGRTYMRADRFLNDCAYEILHHPYLRTGKPFTGVQWKKLLPTSYEIAQIRNMRRPIIGRVNYELGYPCHKAFKIKVRNPLMKVEYDERELGIRKRGPRKYPEDRAQLIEHLKELVSNLRTEDGNPVTTIIEWRHLHPGSHRTAQNARVHLIVASELGLERNRSPKSDPNKTKHKVPEDPDDLKEYLLPVVRGIRNDDGNKISTMEEWMTYHPSSYEIARNALIHIRIATELGYTDSVTK
jgi:hypothetical protein